MPKDTSNKKRTDGKPPPRPSNRFFIYRAEQTALHKKLNPHDHQTDISKIIAERWKHESPEVIAKYEEKAQAAKAKHKLLYPDYKYQPKSKQQKQVEREEQKAKRPTKKTRAGSTSSPAPSSVAATPVHTPTVLPYPLVQPNVPHPAFLPQANHPMYYPHLYYGNVGPTPPLSAAPTPTDVDTDEQPDTPNNASPSTSASGKLADASYYSTSIQNPRPQYPPAVAENLLPPTDSEASPPSASTYDFQWMQNSSGLSNDQFNWDNVNADTSHVSQSASLSQESFDVPSSSAGAEFSENIWAYLNVPIGANDPNSLGTAASSLYCLSDFTPGNELEITPGNAELTDLARVFGDDFSTSTDLFSPALNASFSSSLSQNDFASMPFFTDNTTPSSQVLSLTSFASYNTAEHLEPLDTGVQGSSRQVSYNDTPPAATAQQPSTSGASSSSYVPPPGASLAGTRRVAGSWKIPRDFDA
ncbi:hypothetical protein PLEOSDRAFT_1104604 [Pleurotus ostreatus PC15]|uniref:HMG box domain-containing protein n=1 Tax=Pleurotus ostreatus (strain PC15) TaxID=1137138 RepID=A0A067NLP5_PLEO1|nr:hypothetical protein PLEOSDRAFT_1104604 [Pleurotus ostreatus PC15]